MFSSLIAALCLTAFLPLQWFALLQPNDCCSNALYTLIKCNLPDCVQSHPSWEYTPPVPSLYLHAETERAETQRDRVADRQREKHRQRETKRQRNLERGRQAGRQTERRERQTGRERNGQGETEKHRKR